ncbi:MAG: MvaI/BcnI family restriction endonuclease [Clostridium sp.]|nr:MvaI/BcnI family restriction endonuclease [Clostridium sp.]MCM1443885.1 MvaI/BcnI family restriction endonuclease [Candidatus Amulumruptor caecigallinarius]
MNNNIHNLYEKYKDIEKLGWIKSEKNRKGISGVMFEELIGINPENFEIPDFNDIEIKVRNNEPTGSITLFSATPDSYLFEIKRLQENYGYPDKNYPQYKVLQATTSCISPKRVSNKYYFKLDVDHKKNIVTLIIFNNILNIIDRKTAWSFDLLKEKLERKLKYLCLITSHTRYNENNLYVKYNGIKFFKLKDFKTFIHLIENGTIKISFNIGIYKTEKNFGKTFDHGTNFTIPRYAIAKLFTKININ